MRPAVLLASLLLAAVAAAAACASPDARAGEAMYRRGLLPSGQPLRGLREAGLQVEGAAAACVNCHRRSGLGMTEGRISIPPIAGSYLFHPRARTADDLDLPFVENMRPDRDPYTEATLAQAIRAGIGADGKALSYLMPRFDLDDAQMADLISYLQDLSPGRVPGVTDSVLHFATVVTPDADPVERQGVLDVLQKFFDDKNHYTRAQSPRLRSTQRRRFMANRHWELHVWQLRGAADTWRAQLQARLAAEPVFAVISGVGGSDWEPVHRFCEDKALPCLFPNVDLPVVSDDNFDNVYFSRGVLLEAQLMAHHLRALRAQAKVQRIVQVYREGDVGKAAAAALVAAMGGGAQGRDARLPVIERALPAAAGAGALQAAIAGLESGDALILWLRSRDIGALETPPSLPVTVLLSGRMAGLEHAPLAPGWRVIAHMTYPFDLPAHDVVQRDYPLGWFRLRRIPVVAEQAQADTYLACIILSDTLNHMADSFIRDYLVERIESTLEHRILTGYYPRLALAPGQRFASKGGYIVKFAGPTGTAVAADGGWIVP